MSVAKSGSTVKKDDVIAEFDRQYMLTRLDDYKAAVAVSEASYRRQVADNEVTRKAHDQTILKAKADTEKATLDLKTAPVRGEIDTERLKLAHEESLARHKQVQEETQYVDIKEKAEMRGSEIDLQQSKLELKRAETNADRMIVRAPMEGIVVMQNTFRGTEFGAIQQGDQLFPGQLYMQIVDPSSMVINAATNQVDIESLRIGMKARIRFDAYPDLELPAKVVMIGAMTRSGRTRLDFMKEIPVRLKLEKLDPRVIPDLSVSADVIISKSDENAMLVPLAGVFAGESSGQPFVYVRTAVGWTRREIELGLINNIQAVVVKGLDRGEVIALDPPRLRGPGENLKS